MAYYFVTWTETTTYGATFTFEDTDEPSDDQIWEAILALPDDTKESHFRGVEIGEIIDIEMV